jgi:hypothetical protein
MWWWIIGGTAVVLGLVAALAYKPLRDSLRRSQFARARKEFRRHRERLEAEFFTRAASSGKPRGLRWTDCDFENDVTYARNRRHGTLNAFVGVTISFEAIEGGGMENVAAVSNLRAGSAEFVYVKNAWQTSGRVIFNLEPADAIAYYEDELEMVEQEVARRA